VLYYIYINKFAAIVILFLSKISHFTNSINRSGFETFMKKFKQTQAIENTALAEIELEMI
jgi:hypothetical protein